MVSLFQEKTFSKAVFLSLSFLTLSSETKKLSFHHEYIKSIFIDFVSGILRLNQVLKALNHEK